MRLLQYVYDLLVISTTSTLNFWTPHILSNFVMAKVYCQMISINQAHLEFEQYADNIVTNVKITNQLLFSCFVFMICHIYHNTPGITSFPPGLFKSESWHPIVCCCCSSTVTPGRPGPPTLGFNIMNTSIATKVHHNWVRLLQKQLLPDLGYHVYALRML